MEAKRITYANPTAIDRLLELRKAGVKGGGIGDRAFRVGVTLACVMDGRSGTIDVTREEIVLHTGISSEHVSHAMRELEGKFVSKVQQPRRGYHCQILTGALECHSGTESENLQCHTGTVECHSGTEECHSGTEPNTYNTINNVTISEVAPESPSEEHSERAATPQLFADPDPKTPLRKKKGKEPKPKVTFNGRTFDIPEVQLAAWKEAYPALDVTGCIRKATGWFIADGQKKKDIGKFLNNWLSRQEERRLQTGQQVEGYVWTDEQAAAAQAAADVIYAERKAVNG